MEPERAASDSTQFEWYRGNNERYPVSKKFGAGFLYFPA